MMIPTIWLRASTRGTSIAPLSLYSLRIGRCSIKSGAWVYSTHELAFKKRKWSDFFCFSIASSIPEAELSHSVDSYDRAVGTGVSKDRVVFCMVKYEVTLVFIRK